MLNRGHHRRSAPLLGRRNGRSEQGELQSLGGRVPITSKADDGYVTCGELRTRGPRDVDTDGVHRLSATAATGATGTREGRAAGPNDEQSATRAMLATGPEGEEG